MPVTSGFFNSVNHDRLYDAEQISSIFDGIIEDGVYANIGDAFYVSPYEESNDTIIVGTGRAWFDHTWTLNDTPLSLVLDPPNGVLSRIDTVVIDVDRTDRVRKNSIMVVSSGYSSDPTPPTLINEERHKQHPIANILVPPGTSQPIQAHHITYLVGTDDCPIVMCPLKAMNIENYFKQMQDEFEIWFDGIKDILDENVAGNLQNQIDDLKNQVTVSDSGEVGDYVIAFSKPVMEALKNGGANAHMSGREISYKCPDSGFTGKTPKPYSQSFILPDGKICIPAFEYGDDVVDRTMSESKFRVRIVDQQGLYTDTTASIQSLLTSYNPSYPEDHPPAGGLTSKYIFQDNFCITNLKADSFPVSFVVAFTGCKMVRSTNLPAEIQDYRKVQGQISNFMIYAGVTISATGVVSIGTYGESLYHHFQANSGSTTVSMVPEISYTTAFPAYDIEEDSLYYFTLSGADDYPGKQYQVIIYKINSDGVVTSNNKLIRKDDTHDLSTSEVNMYGYFDDTTNVIIFGENKSKGLRVEVNTSTLANELTFATSSTIPSDYPLPSYGSIESLSNKSITKNTYNYRKLPTSSNEGTFDPIVLYNNGVSLVNSANIFIQKDLGSTIVAYYINTGSNSRIVFYGKNGISIYASTAPNSITGSNKMTADRLLKNKYRVREIDGVTHYLFDSSTNPYTASSSFAVLSVSYDSED